MRPLGRLLLAWVFLRAGPGVLQKPEPRAATAAWLLDPIPVDPVLLVRANAATQMAAAVLLALGVKPRLAALALAASMVPTTLGGHAYWLKDDPAQRAQQQIQFNKNLAIIGGLLVAALED
jgi:putative oxidoreductase